MWNELTRNWPRRWRLYAVIGAFPALCLLAVIWGFAPDESGGAVDDPGEGVYWSASQYQIHFGKLREALLRVSGSREPMEQNLPLAPQTMRELLLRADILTSRTRLLSEPSLTRDRLRLITGFDERVVEMTAFDARVRQSLQSDSFTSANARALLLSFDAMDRTVESFANTARQREMEDRTQLFEMLRHRRVYALVVAALLIGWLAWILLAQRSDRRLARERLTALESEQLAKSELRQSINTKAQFLSMVSHELRSPLQVIVSSVDLLDLGTPAAERRSAVARIRRAAMMLGVQLRDLLTIARGEAGRFEINPESFEATSLVEDVAEIAAHAAREKGLQFRTSVPPEPVFARADVQRISQVLANLVSNAVRYTQAGHVSLALLESVESSGRLTFVVSDTGPGLPQGGVKSLRTPMSRDEELRPRKDGSGVGLSVVRTVLDHLGGTVDVHVRPGEGTRFTVKIPVLFEDPDALPSEATPDGLVLVVDDRPDITASVAALVERYGHPCHVARSGPEAATMLAQNAYETVFLDLDLPGIGGIELASRLRRDAGLNQRAYIVAITAARPEIPDGLFDEVLVKPVEGLRVWWNLAHRSRAQRPVSAAEPASPPSEP